MYQDLYSLCLEPRPQIGEHLGISLKTVETHVTAVLRKLQLTNRRAVIRWAAERGF